MFDITPDARDYIRKKGTDITVVLWNHHAEGG